MMKVEITRNLEVNLLGMSFEEATALQTMIEQAGLGQRRVFHDVLRQLKLPFDQLMTDK